MYECYNMMSLQRDIKFVSRDRIFLLHDKSVDLTGVLSCRATLFECLRHNHLSLRGCTYREYTAHRVSVHVFVAFTDQLVSFVNVIVRDCYGMKVVFSHAYNIAVIFLQIK